MKALILKEYNHFEYEEVPLPQIGDQEVLIQVKACGICGSDVHGMDGSTGRRRPPVIMGHEAAGVIEKTGNAVKDWTRGDRVTFDSTVYCGTCWYCRRGQINLCDNRRVLGVSCEEYRQYGAFADYVVIPQRILYRLPEKITFEQAAMTEALSIAVHAVEMTPIALGDTSVVVGTGMIGQLVVQVLRQKGCRTVIAIDVSPEKLQLAKQSGADVVLNPSVCDVIKEILDLTEGRGADVALEAVGATASIRTSVNVLRKGGNLTLIGNVTPQIEFPLQTVVTREIRVQGSCASRGEYPACLEMIASGKVNVDMLISATVPLKEGSSWFNRLYRKEEGLFKVILKP